MLVSSHARGTENILDDLHWLQSNGYLGAGDALGQVDFGWDNLLVTAISTFTMAVNSYTLTNSTYRDNAAICSARPASLGFFQPGVRRKVRLTG